MYIYIYISAYIFTHIFSYWVMCICVEKYCQILFFLPQNSWRILKQLLQLLCDMSAAGHNATISFHILL